MLRATLPILLLLPGLVIGSCAVGNFDDDEVVANAEESISLGQATLPGTWRARAYVAGQPQTLVLKTDGTYHSEKLVVCMRAPCPALAEDGGYRAYDDRRVSYLALFDRSKDVEQYEYVVRHDELRIRRVGPAGEWYTMTRFEPAWCAVPRDCALQDLPLGPPLTYWHCAQNTCSLGHVRPVEDSTIPQPIVEE